MASMTESKKVKAELTFDDTEHSFQCKGDWTILELDDFIAKFRRSSLPEAQKLKISGKDLSAFDSAGAVALWLCVSDLEKRRNEIEFVHFSQTQKELLELVKSKEDALGYQIPPEKKESLLYSLGKETIHKINQFDGLIILIGDLSTRLFEAFGNWRRFQLPSIISVVHSAGIQALPIVGLLSFLIGIVLAYQMGLQLETYGANIFIAYLSGMAIFREFAPLITAIIVAGRTSSAFTAQLGSMKINEEIDALLTMGLSPTELLVMPKVLGLLLTFPLLIFWSDVFSILGAMIMSKYMLGISYIDFLTRLRDSVGLKQMMLGLYKAPTFAILIALVGCFQGFRVKSSADSVGTHTTKSVVQALFLIIVADAVYSIIYSWMNL